MLNLLSPHETRPTSPHFNRKLISVLQAKLLSALQKLSPYRSQNMTGRAQKLVA